MPGKASLAGHARELGDRASPDAVSIVVPGRRQRRARQASHPTLGGRFVDRGGEASRTPITRSSHLCQLIAAGGTVLIERLGDRVDPAIQLQSSRGRAATRLIPGLAIIAPPPGRKARPGSRSRRAGIRLDRVRLHGLALTHGSAIPPPEYLANKNRHRADTSGRRGRCSVAASSVIGTASRRAGSRCSGPASEAAARVVTRSIPPRRMPGIRVRARSRGSPGPWSAGAIVRVVSVASLARVGLAEGSPDEVGTMMLRCFVARSKRWDASSVGRKARGDRPLTCQRDDRPRFSLGLGREGIGPDTDHEGDTGAPGPLGKSAE